MIQSVLILGGGTAGLIAALSLKTHLPQLSVRVVRSKEIGIIGVGEGSTADLPNHLHGFLNIDPQRLPVPAEIDRWNDHRRVCVQNAANGLTMSQALAVIRDPRWSWTKGFYGV